MRKILNILKSRLFVIGVLIALQFALLVWLVLWFKDSFYFAYIFFIVLSALMSFYIINKDDNPSYKILWILAITLFPLFGGVIYLLFGGQKVPKELRTIELDVHESIKISKWQNQDLMDRLKKENLPAFKQSNYLWGSAGFPSYEHTQTEFLPIGEVAFEAMMKELREAESFIFMEYFIIAPGLMWNSILNVLIQKAKEGLDVRVMYDSAGCFTTLPKDYYKELQSYGIKAKEFNRIRPSLAVQMNNRDHRKIMVVDGKVAITGGNNLADEYINRKERFGHWRDSGVLVRGEAVWSFTLMFLQFWNYKEELKDNVFDFKVDPSYSTAIPHDGLVQPFSDAPTDDENVGENVHMNMINNANDYIYATTPYLILDHEMKIALRLAAKNGIDVRIIVPHIPDKAYAFFVTQFNYKALLEAGVRIYEYEPGFIHSKTMVVDDTTAFIGTVNMDYRSYYLHYECGIWCYKSKAVTQCRDDFEKVLDMSIEITMEDVLATPWYKKIAQSVFNLFGPLM